MESDHRARSALPFTGPDASWRHAPQAQTGHQVTMFPPQLKTLTGLRSFRKERIRTWLVDYVYENTLPLLQVKCQVCILH